MGKSRDKQRFNKKLGQIDEKLIKVEERLNAKTEWNISDPTPLGAVDNIIEKQKYICQYRYTDSNIRLESFID